MSQVEISDLDLPHKSLVAPEGLEPHADLLMREAVTL